MSIDFNNAAYISAARAKYSDAENAARHVCLGSDLVRHGIEAAPCTGVYSGIAEASYICKAIRFEDQINLKKLARRYEQEAILWTWLGEAQLWNAASGLYETIGRIREVDDSVKLEDHTRLSDGRLLVVA